MIQRSLARKEPAMAFVLTLGFAEHDKNNFEEKTLPKVRGHQSNAPASTEESGLYRVSVAVTSPSAAREVCHLLVAFLAHSKHDFVNVEWTGADGSAQIGQVSGKAARDAEVVAVRVGAAAKAHLDQEKEAATSA